MERLQAAIKKARAQRDGTPLPRSVNDPARRPPTQRALLTDEAWSTLPELSVDARKMHQRRIIAFDGGPAGAPYDMLRTRMLQQARHNGWKRIALVSPHSGCGKSTSAVNLAFSLSRQSELRSVILDLDLRRSGMTRIMGQQGPFGMAEVLQGEAGFADHARRYGSNVAFGFNSGARVQTAAEILQSTRTADTLADIQQVYAPDIMLFDMPPLYASDDNFGFLQNVDAALILVAADKTAMSQIDLAERHVAELTNVMGLVLNKCRYNTGAYGHEYDYY
ncbi:MAG: CpsD/CapB family tyrosine-protein kinase [Marinibacterium sp.]